MAALWLAAGRRWYRLGESVGVTRMPFFVILYLGGFTALLSGAWKTISMVARLFITFVWGHPDDEEALVTLPDGLLHSEDDASVGL
jgi:hypothetical protein